MALPFCAAKNMHNESYCFISSGCKIKVDKSISFPGAFLKNHSCNLHAPLCEKFIQNLGQILHNMPFRIQIVKYNMPFGYISWKAFLKHALETRSFLEIKKARRTCPYRKTVFPAQGACAESFRFQIPSFV